MSAKPSSVVLRRTTSPAPGGRCKCHPGCPGSSTAPGGPSFWQVHHECSAEARTVEQLSEGCGQGGCRGHGEVAGEEPDLRVDDDQGIGEHIRRCASLGHRRIVRRLSEPGKATPPRRDALGSTLATAEHGGDRPTCGVVVSGDA